MIQIEREKLEMVLESLENNKKNHHYCEDTWYSCPKHEEGCANEAEGDECNCGADEINAQFDEAITIIKDVLAQPEQEPVAWYCKEGLKRGVSLKQESPEWKPLYTTSPQRTWVGLTPDEIRGISLASGESLFSAIMFTHDKLKEKNT